MLPGSGAARDQSLPRVTLVVLAYNRRDPLRINLTKSLREVDYPRDLLDVVVVDNASNDGTAEMVTDEFPEVHLIARTSNSGVSAWNDGFEIASGEYVLVLDDDCYLPPAGLRTAVAELQRHRADLVSFGVVSSEEPTHRFDLHEYITGLLSFWGCAFLARRETLQSLGGFDPEIFLYAHELEFMLRFFDGGYRHLHLPEVVAVHMRAPNDWRGGRLNQGPYRLNHRNWGYIAAKLLTPRDALEALIALLVRNVRDGLRVDPAALKGLADTLRGFLHGLTRRKPVRPAVSRTYRRNFETFASPWWVSRSPHEMARDVLLPTSRREGDLGHRHQWLEERRRYYPDGAGVLDL
jgi:GT2 family glycosyltransferase